MSQQEIEKFIKEIQKIGEVFSKVRIINFSSHSAPLQECPAAQSIFSIEPTGDIVACPYLYQISQSFSIGNILKNSPQEIKLKMEYFHGTIKKRMDQLISETSECKKCRVIEQCGGGCYAETFAFEKISSPEPICKYTSHNLKTKSTKKGNIGSPIPLRSFTSIAEKCGTNISSQTIKKIHEIVYYRICESDVDIAHKFDHVREVVNIAKYLAKKERANERIVIPAAYFHDFEPRQPPHFHLHTDASALEACYHLDQLGFTEPELIHITHCIIASSYHSYTSGILPQTLEAEVIRDADWLDAIGARGIARVFGFAGAYCKDFGEYSGNPEFPKFQSQSLKSVDETPFKHFDTKLLKINELLLTETGRKLGARKHNYMVNFIKTYQEETLIELEQFPKEIPMKASTEFEIKSLAPKSEKLKTLLDEFTCKGSAEQHDIYYDTEGRMLFRKGIYVRIRNGTKLEIKYNPNFLDDSHETCDEYSFQLKKISKKQLNSVSFFLGQHLGREVIEPTDVVDLLNKYGMSSFVVIKKTRLSYQSEGVDISIDSVQGLGEFVEIEVTDHNMVQYYRDWAADHGLKHIPTGYVELYLKDNEFDTYINGRYLLMEDRNKVTARE